MEDEWKDDRIVVFCARLSHLQQGWNLIRMMDMRGKDSGATLLVQFQIEDVSLHHRIGKLWHSLGMY
jgi:phosphatidylinositol phospholipase C delta